MFSTVILSPCTYNQILSKPMGPPGIATWNNKFSTDNVSSWEYLKNSNECFLKCLIQIGFNTQMKNCARFGFNWLLV